MMKTVAIHPGHNATVALFEGGRVVAMLSQERCDDQKNSAKFPAEAFNMMLKQVGWHRDEIGEVCIAGRQVYPLAAYAYLFTPAGMPVRTNRFVRIGKSLQASRLGRIVPQPFSWLQSIRTRRQREKGARELQENLVKAGLGGKPLYFVDHHECHARSVYHGLTTAGDTSPALIFTLDGSGDDLCATVTVADGNGRWERIAVSPPSASLGGIYSNTTRFLGMKILEHEYKVMGLAPYARKRYMLDTYDRIFKPVIRLSSKKPLVFESSVNVAHFYTYLKEVAVGERFDNLAAGLQHLTETLVVQWIRNGIQQTGIKRIFTSGGLFMNVKLNRQIQEMPEVERVYFMPSCGDESNPLGAGYHRAMQRGEKAAPLEHLYLGVGYSDAEIEQFLGENGCEAGYEIMRPEDIETTIAKMLAEGEIVARFSGRCEWGARSLGNRSILAHPARMESFYTVNDYIKSRDFWMPFAPSILDSAAARYLEKYDPFRVAAPFMITAFAATPLGVQHLRAAMHQGDHTVRPQVVQQVTNPGYYRLISKFEELTGIGAVLNTSLNLHGSPLAATPAQALATFANSELKHMAMEGFLLSKKED